jgi:Dolichyl-phosphate-mannose-protein mannosyltransferase
LFSLTSWLLYVLARQLYGERAGLTALIGLNVTPFFFASAGSWIVPDGPLLAALATAALTITQICLRAPSKELVWPLWLGVGAAFGVAGLSKYSAALPAFGFLAFLATSSNQRRWFRHPALYAAAVIGLLIVAPVFIWNAQHDWVSFRFQGARGEPSEGFDPLAVGSMLLGQAGYLLPWIFVALLTAALAGFRTARLGDERARLLLWLAAPTILVFTITPLWGARGLPHWTMPGWFFLYPLLGDTLVRRGYGRRAALASTTFLALLVLFTVTQQRFGWIERMAAKPLSDPTLESLAWTPIQQAQALNPRPAFVATTKWWEAGAAGVALGPDVPVFVFSNDPRGVAFLDNAEDFVGRDGVIIAEARRLPYIQSSLSGYFQSLGPPEPLNIGRGVIPELKLVLVPAHGLTHTFPVPYPLAGR